LGVPPEIRKSRRKIEKVAEKLKVPLKIGNFR
jgi:hypothetical protein